MSAQPGPCNWCDRDPAAGFASIIGYDGEQHWYCHDDDSPTCYERAQGSMVVVAREMADDGPFSPPQTLRALRRSLGWDVLDGGE